MNSRCAWFQLFASGRIKRGGYVEAEAQYIAALSLPDAVQGDRECLSELVESVTNAAALRLSVQSAVRHRILADLAPPDCTKLSRKLAEWWTLDFASFRDEIKRVFHIDIPVEERGDWESYLAEKGAEVRALTAKIEAAESAIDAIVYRLFDLSPEEIALLGAAIAGQY